MNLLIHVPTLSVMGIFAVFPAAWVHGSALPCTHASEATPPRPHAAHVSQASHASHASRASRATDATVTQPMLSCDYVSFMIAFLHIFSNFADYG